MIDENEVIELLEELCRAFSVEDGHPFAVINSADGPKAGHLVEEQSEVIMNVAEYLESLEY